MEKTELMLGGAGLLVFLVCAFRGRRTWLFLDMVLSIVGAVILLADPSSMLMFDFKLDTLHEYLMRIRGVGALIWAFFIYKFHSSNDEIVQVSIITSRVVELSLGLLGLLHLFFNQGQTVAGLDKELYFYLAVCFLMLFGYIIQSLKMGEYAGAVRRNTRLNNVLRIDFFYTFLLAIVYYAYPAGLLKKAIFGVKVNFYHMLYARSIGGMLMNSAFISFVAPGFNNEKDKRTVLLARLLGYVGVFAVMGGTQYMYQCFDERMLMLGLCMAGVVMANALFGFVFARGEKQD